MYVPLAESEMILHLPDLVHEMGHILIHHLLDVRVTAFCDHYKRCREIVDQHYRHQLANRRTSGGPNDYFRLEAHLRQQWLDKWLEEIVCDLFAVFVLGPPFVWAHCHLAAKQCKHIFSFSHDQVTTHPADDARMKAMLAQSLACLVMPGIRSGKTQRTIQNGKRNRSRFGDGGLS